MSIKIAARFDELEQKTKKNNGMKENGVYGSSKTLCGDNLFLVWISMNSIEMCRVPLPTVTYKRDLNWEASNYYEAIKFRSWLVSNWWYCTHLSQHRNHTVHIFQVFEWLRKRKTHSEYVKHQNMNTFSLRREGMISLTIHRLRPVLCKLSHKICSFFWTCNFGNQEEIWCTFSRKK